MKTPDKIYLPGDIDWPSAAILTLGNQPGDAEYIRKDALLKWIEETRAIPHDGAMWRDKAFQEVVNHLNTM